MSSGIITTILEDTEFVASVLGSLSTKLASSQTFQTIENAIPEVLVALATNQASFRVGAYTVTAKINGNPTALTVSAAFLGIENVVAGKTGVFTSGDIEIDIVPTVPTTTVPTTSV